MCRTHLMRQKGEAKVKLKRKMVNISEGKVANTLKKNHLVNP